MYSFNGQVQKGLPDRMRVVSWANVRALFVSSCHSYVHNRNPGKILKDH